MLESLSASEILNVPTSECERIFGPTETEAKEQYRHLSKRWYPRKDGDDGRVFAHISLLHRVALQKIRAGQWKDPRVETIMNAGKEVKFTVLKRFKFELGEAVTGQDELLFLIDNQYDDLYLQALAAQRIFTNWPSSRVRKEVERYLPKFSSYPAPMKTERRAVSTVRDRRLIRLRDIKEPLDPKHVAWIVSSLYDLLCYLQVMKLTHNAISLDNYWIEPEAHYGALLGGWWYAVPVGQRLAALPTWALAEAPAGFRAQASAGVAKAKGILGLLQLKALARELLGDRPGGRLLHDKKIPRALATWAVLPPGDHPIKEYAGWQDVLKDSFGARRYTKLDLRASDIYGKE